MQVFRVEDMSCGHCVATITQALQQAAPGAVVEIDLTRHLVQVEGAQSDVVEQAIRNAGYSPRAV